MNNLTINTPDSRKNDGYHEFEQSIINQFNSMVANDTPIFTTNAENLWKIYLDNLPEEGRQHYNCNTCRSFIEKYGNLAVLTENGVLESIVWAKNVPSFFEKSVKELRSAIGKARINGIFKSDDKNLGQSRTGEWTHLHIILPKERVNKSITKTASQMMAEKLEDYRMLSRALQEYSIDTVDQAVTLLQSETLYRSDKCLGIAQWFKNLCSDRLNCTNSRMKENVVWMYVAKAPEGFCHVKSSMIGTLLDDIQSGMDFQSIKHRFAEKMNPNNYMRAQSAPTVGAIQQAEKFVEKMGIASSLRRRYAKIEEIPFLLWKNYGVKPNFEMSKKIGIFSGITPKGQTTVKNNNLDIPVTTMTWDKFQRTILPTAESIEAKIDNSNKLMAMVTASDETSKNILQWNNTFSWYYHGGIDADMKQRVENAGGRYENNEIRCSLAWDNYTDLDLHCMTPRGEHIYFSTKRSRCGGWLDVDMNAGYGTTDKPVENIRWSDNAPNGHYRFYVHNFSERGNGKTPFRVELEINGKTYHYDGKPLAYKREVTVFEFDYVKGQQTNIKSDIVGNSSNVADWNITDEFVKVTGITTSPNLWGENKVEHAGTHIFFLLDGCKDLSQGKGRGFFNEMLKSELREHRKTLEAYTANTPIEDVENATACGIGYCKDREWNLTLKVVSGGSTRFIKIDRWD